MNDIDISQWVIIIMQQVALLWLRFDRDAILNRIRRLESEK